MTNLEKYQRVFMETFSVTADVLDDRFTFREVPSWDSVAHLTLISALEDVFDVMFEAEDILHYGSYRNGIEILKRYGVDF